MLQEFCIPKIVGSFIIAAISYIIFLSSLKGIIKINTLLIPTLLLLIVFLGIKKINSIEIIKTNFSFYWLLSSILYASYNSISLIPILITLKKYIKTKKEAKLVSICTFFIMLLLSLIIFCLINKFWKEIKTIEIPIVYIASTNASIGKYIFGFLILLSIVTTAISAGFSFLNNTTSSRKKYLRLGLMICLIANLFGQLTFSKLIGFLYPVFGYLGIIQIFFLLIA